MFSQLSACASRWLLLAFARTGELFRRSASVTGLVAGQTARACSLPGRVLAVTRVFGRASYLWLCAVRHLGADGLGLAAPLVG
jgi:hypothetical protein